MDPILYNAATGGKADFNKQAIIANNLANVNTPGFKADLYQAQTMYLNTNGANEANNQSFNVQAPNGIDLTPGDLITTGRDLDVAVSGDGWISLKDSQGRQVYARGGSLQVGTNGQLMTSSGKLVLGDGGPISIPPAKSVEIGSDGTISIIPMEGDSNSLAVLDRIKLVTLDKNNLVKNEEGMLQLKQGAATPVADASVKLVNGAIEGSNVKAIEQMVEMISVGREYEAQMKVLSTVDDNSQKLAQLLHQ